MPVLTASQAYSYARGAGFDQTNAVIAVAVMYAESGGHYADSQAVQQNGGGRGPMQVDITQNPQYDATQLTNNPAYNFAAAYKIWKSLGWSNGWTTYRTGAYKQYLGAAMGGASGNNAILTSFSLPPGLGLLPGLGGFSGSSGVPSLNIPGVSSIANFVKWFTDAKNWERIAYFILGAALLWVGAKQIALAPVQKIVSGVQNSGVVKAVVEAA